MFYHRKQIVTAVRNENVVIIAGDTGCGKSTQVPQYLLEAGYKRIGKLIFCLMITIFVIATWQAQLVLP
jgi:HrpA-like RNA helicase